MIDALCQLGGCRKKATHYGQVIWGKGGSTDYYDGYWCEADARALPVPGETLSGGGKVIETTIRPLPA